MGDQEEDEVSVGSDVDEQSSEEDSVEDHLEKGEGSDAEGEGSSDVADDEDEEAVKDEEEEEGSDSDEDNEAEVDDEEEAQDAQQEDVDEDAGNKVKDEDGEEEELGNKTEGISGWADSIAKILKSGKPKNKKELMLSRARKDYEVSKSAREPRPLPKDNLEIVPGPKIKSEEESSVKEEKKPKIDDNILSLKKQRQFELKQKKLERAWENLSRLTTEKTDPTIERDLVKIATKGVVQLFNAISMQQKTVKSKMKNRKSEFQKDKVLHQTKDIFDTALTKSKQMGKEREDLDIKVKTEVDDEELKRSSGRKRKSGDNRESRNSKKKPAWSALQDNYMLDAKLKDWDQNSDDSE